MKRSFLHSSRSSVFPTLLVILAALPAANAQTYRIRELPPPNASGTSLADGINEAGVVVGIGLTFSGNNRALRWINGTPSDLGALPGFSISYAHDISNNNRIVGISGNSCEPTAPTRWDAGQMEALPDLQHVSTEGGIL